MPKQSKTKKPPRRKPVNKKLVTKKKPAASKRVRAKKVLTISKEPAFSPFTRTGLLIIIALLTAVYLLIPNYGTGIAYAKPSWAQIAKDNGCPINRVFGIPPTISEKVNTHPKCTRMMKRVLLVNAPSRITKHFKEKNGVSGKFTPGLTTAIKLIKKDFKDTDANGKITGVVDSRMWQIIIYIQANGYSPDADNAPTGPADGSGKCINPLQGISLRMDRTDRGVDYYTGGNEPVRAICDGIVQSVIVPGWGDYNAYIQYKLTSFPSGHPELLGKCIFMAEDIKDIKVGVGQSVKAGALLGTLHGDTEWGWSAKPGSPSAAKGVNDGTTPGGRAFARFLRSLGANTREDPKKEPDGSSPFFAGTPCP